MGGGLGFSDQKQTRGCDIEQKFTGGRTIFFQDQIIETFRHQRGQNIRLVPKRNRSAGWSGFERLFVHVAVSFEG